MTVPKTMNQVSIREPGEPDVLFADTGKIPEVGTGEVLIKVKAAGINRPDVMQRQGNYNPPPGASQIPGLEVAGEVVLVADDVTEYKVGDKVCALVSGGGYAEYCNAPVPQVLPIPAGLSMIEAAGVPENYFTVWTNVFQRGGLKKEKPSSFMEDLVELGQRQFSWLISMELKLLSLQVVKKNAEPA